MYLKLNLAGESPLLMHNVRLANPLDSLAREMKAITGKRGKSDDDYQELSRLEFYGGLYHDPEHGPYIPGDNVFRALIDAAAKSRQGPLVKTGVIVTSAVNPLEYDGPRSVDKLWATDSFRHYASAKVDRNRVMRTRPVFKEWATSVDLFLDTEILNFENLSQIADVAGRLIGIGDWRPRFGQFKATLTETAS